MSRPLVSRPPPKTSVSEDSAASTHADAEVVVDRAGICPNCGLRRGYATARTGRAIGTPPEAVGIAAAPSLRTARPRFLASGGQGSDEFNQTFD